MKNNKHIQSFKEHQENLNISYVINRNNLSFTKIQIKRIVKDVFVGEFSFTYDNGKMIETTMKGNSVQNVIEKIEKFLKVKLNDDDYMIIRTDKGEPIFIGFFTFDNGEIYKDGWHYKDKQKMIDTWCGEENEH